MSNTKRSTVLLVATLLVATVSACGNNDVLPAGASGEAVRVTTEVIGAASVAASYEAVGTINPAVSSVLSSESMGRVLKVHVREGDRVRAGQVLIEIDGRAAAAQASKAGAGRKEAQESLVEVERSIEAAEQALAAAEAQARLEKITFDRYTKLLERRSVSRQEFDQVEARHRVAAAQVLSAKANVAAMRSRRRAVQARIEQAGADVEAASVVVTYHRIAAPYAGVVTRKTVDVGTMATPGLPLLVVEDDRVLRLDASVEEAFANNVFPGESVPVTIAALGELRLEGRIAEVSPSADPASRSVTVKIELPATTGLRSGMYGRAEFARGERTMLSIPKTALVERGQIVSVFVVDGQGIARLRVVTLGKEAGERVEVLSGLADGERVVVTGRERLTDGRAVIEEPR